MNVAVVTTHNEEATIGDLVRAIPEQTIVVDEGSTDRTRREAHVAGALVFRYEGGIGPCQRRGWRVALDMDAERIIQLDAGGSHDPHQIRYLLDADADLVIGSRFRCGGTHEGTWWRSSGSRSFAALCNARYHQRIGDWTSGFRVISAYLAERLLGFEYRATMHGWQAESLRNAVGLGATVKEVAIDYRPSASSLRPAVIAEALRVLA